MTCPLSDEMMISLGCQYFRMADRSDATENDQAALRDFVPALLHRLRERAVAEPETLGPPTSNSRLCGTALRDEAQIEMLLPQPE
ncbi:hypothetical protein [Novosphingobium gossypii]|uniref:hypothetical protein n=1 Tax=Novosphingobium gossypii TaxID=1604774 RepID=UPI003D1A0E27